MRLYESVFIARQDVSTTQVENLTKEFLHILKMVVARFTNMNIGVCALLPIGLRKTGKAIMSC